MWRRIGQTCLINKTICTQPVGMVRGVKVGFRERLVAFRGLTESNVAMCENSFNVLKLV